MEQINALANLNREVGRDNARGGWSRSERGDEAFPWDFCGVEYDRMHKISIRIYTEATQSLDVYVGL